jgi:hypothetical protein
VGVSSSPTGPAPLDPTNFLYGNTAAGGAISITGLSQPDGANGRVELTTDMPLADSDVNAISGDQISALSGQIFDAVGNSMSPSHTVKIAVDPQLAPASPSAISTTVIAAAAGGIGFLIIVIIVVSVYSCRKRGKTTDAGTGVRIELKDLSPDEIMAKFDVNKDGVLDQKELNNLMEKIVVTDKQKGSLEQQTKSSSDLHISIK